MNLFPTEVRVVEEMREEYEVGEVDQHAENDVFLRLEVNEGFLISDWAKMDIKSFSEYSHRNNQNLRAVIHFTCC